MSEAVIAAIVTAVISLIGTIITVLSANRQTISALDKKQEISDEKIRGEINVIKTEIKTLSDRVEKHNSMIERTFKLEGEMQEVQHDIRDLKDRRTA